MRIEYGEGVCRLVNSGVMTASILLDSEMCKARKLNAFSIFGAIFAAIAGTRHGPMSN